MIQMIWICGKLENYLNETIFKFFTIFTLVTQLDYNIYIYISYLVLGHIFSEIENRK